MASQLRIVRETQDAIDLLAWLGERHGGAVALDTETSGVNPLEPGFQVRLVQVGDSHEAWVIPFQQWQGLVAEMIYKFTGTWIIHNANFDINALAAHGIVVPWHQVDDTMIAMRLAETTRPAGLKEAAARHVVPGAAVAQRSLHQAMTKQGWGWDTVPLDFPTFLYYAGMDVILTHRLYEHPVCRRGLTSPVYPLEMQTLVVCSAMSNNGMQVDLAYCKAKADELRLLTKEINRDIEARYEVPIGSGRKLGNWFLSQGARITQMTPGGLPSTSKPQLVALLADPNSNEHVRYVAWQVLRYRKADKMAGSYLENFLIMADDDGLLHPNIQTVQAKTGRMSIRHPALQTLPKPGEDPESRMVRKAVIPRDPTHALISADFEQIEMRLAAVLSQDDKLIGAFAVADADSAADFFAEMGKVVYKDPGFTKSDPRRKVIKNTMYGMLYGAGPAKISETAGIPLKDATDARSSIMGAFPGMSRAMSLYEQEAKRRGGVVTMLGRDLTVDPDRAYKGLNAAIQGSAADLFKRALVYLDQAGFRDYMVVPVHDEVVFSIPVDEIEEARHEIRKAMMISELSVPIPAEPSAGMQRWADDE